MEIRAKPHHLPSEENLALELTAYVDAEPILDGTVEEFRLPGIVDAYRSVALNERLHDDEVLRVRTQMQFSVGS